MATCPRHVVLGMEARQGTERRGQVRKSVRKYCRPDKLAAKAGEVCDDHVRCGGRYKLVAAGMQAQTLVAQTRCHAANYATPLKNHILVITTTPCCCAPAGDAAAP